MRRDQGLDTGFQRMRVRVLRGFSRVVAAIFKCSFTYEGASACFTVAERVYGYIALGVWGLGV